MVRNSPHRWSWTAARETEGELSETMTDLENLNGSQRVRFGAALGHIERHGSHPNQVSKGPIHGVTVWVEVSTAIFFWYAQVVDPNQYTMLFLHIVWETGSPPKMQRADWKIAESRFMR
jgi:hypothetical protein